MGVKWSLGRLIVELEVFADSVGWPLDTTGLRFSIENRELLFFVTLNGLNSYSSLTKPLICSTFVERLRIRHFLVLQTSPIPPDCCDLQAYELPREDGFNCFHAPAVLEEESSP